MSTLGFVVYVGAMHIASRSGSLMAPYPGTSASNRTYMTLSQSYRSPSQQSSSVFVFQTGL